MFGFVVLELLDMFKLNDGHSIPALGLGTFVWPNEDQKQIEEAVYHAIGHCGYRHVDCAYVYNNEQGIGRAISRALHDFDIPR